MAGMTAREAYRKGWDAFGRGTGLGLGELRFIARYGDTFQDAFVGGFLDHNSDRPKYHDFNCPLYGVGRECQEAH